MVAAAMVWVGVSIGTQLFLRVELNTVSIEPFVSSPH